jgi:threonine dehydratase
MRHDIGMRRDLENATEIVYRAMTPTPQQRWPLLDERCGAAVWVKHENHTPIGAFKVRGGLVYLDDLRRREPEVNGIVAATRGNHGQAVAYAAARYGMRTVVFVPHGNSTGKNKAMRALGTELIEEGHDFQASLEAAEHFARSRGWHMVPSFHPLLARGAATYSLELLRAVPDLDTLYVPIGLGSGICGAIAARDALDRRTKIVAVVAASAPAYARSLALGRPVSHEVTTRIADGMACRTPVPDALEIIRTGVDRVVEVSDDQIENAMRAIYDDTHNVAEGAAASGLAALLSERERIRGRSVGIVLTGANVDADVFAGVLATLPSKGGSPKMSQNGIGLARESSGGSPMADEQDYVRRGKGQKDQVGPTGIYPASAADAPEDAEVRGQDELGHRTPGQESLIVINEEESGDKSDK